MNNCFYAVTELWTIELIYLIIDWGYERLLNLFYLFFNFLSSWFDLCVFIFLKLCILNFIFIVFFCSKVTNDIEIILTCGHLICKNCKTKRTKCYVCYSKLSATKPHSPSINFINELCKELLKTSTGMD